MRSGDIDYTHEDWLNLQDRALAVAAEGVTIADARLADRPLIYVNEGFERLTGYTAAEALGRNCKFLQGKTLTPGRWTRFAARWSRRAKPPLRS